MPTFSPLTLSDSDFTSSARLRLGLLANAPALRCECGTTVLSGDSDLAPASPCSGRRATNMSRLVGAVSLLGRVDEVTSQRHAIVRVRATKGHNHSRPTTMHQPWDTAQPHLVCPSRPHPRSHQMAAGRSWCTDVVRGRSNVGGRRGRGR
jgi:hypothetical protein